jgi:hypothetical protein
MTNYYQQPLTKEELKQYDNRTEIQYANTFNIKSPMFKSELYDKINLKRMSRQFKHKMDLKTKRSLVINNAVNLHKPLFN